MYELSHEIPLAVCNLDKVTKRYQLWKQHLPEIECFYAVKANNDPIILNHLNSLGSNFDCASKNEMEVLFNMGVSPDRMVFTPPQKFASHIQYAGEIGVDRLVFDCEEEMLKIKENFAGKPKCLIRIVPPFESTNYAHMIKKFGCTTQEAIILLKKASKIGLDVHGICFHVGHCNTSAEPFKAAIKESKLVFDQGKLLGHSMELLDIGGGFPGQSGTEDIFVQIASEIRKTIKEVYPLGIKVFGEPGLFMVCNCITIFAKVIGVRQRNVKHQDVFLNCGMFSCVSKDLLDWYTPEIELIESKRSNGRLLEKTMLWGPTCDPRDWIAEKQWPRMEIGETIRISNAGAYVFNRKSPEFSGYPNPTLSYINEN